MDEASGFEARGPALLMRVDRRREGVGAWQRVMIMIVVALLSVTGQGQTLARRGWAGSGVTVDPWWKDAIFYQVDPRSFREAADDGTIAAGIVSRLDFVRSLGVDALVLSPAPIEPGVLLAAAEQNSGAIAGSDEALDHLIEEAGRRKLRVLVDLPMGSAQSGEELAKVARFWLSRGVAGLRLRLDPEVSAPALSLNQRRNRLHELRQICATYAGQRVLLWDEGERGARSTEGSGLLLTRQHTAEADHMQMIVDRRIAFPALFDAAELRQSLASGETATRAGESTPVLVTDVSERPRSFDRYADGQHDLAIAKVMATVLLLSRGSALLLAGQELGGESSHAGVATEEADQDSLLNWYRRLGVLRHGRAALRNGTMEVMPALGQEVVVWIRRAREGGRMGQAVVVACNFSAQALGISFESELRRMGVRGGAGVLHTLLSSSADSAETVSASQMTLPPFGVYVGELRAQPGLEAIALPARRSRRRSR